MTEAGGPIGLDGSFGALELDEDVEIVYDSFVHAGVSGPVSGVDGSQIQWWNPSWRRGFCFKPVGDVLLHAVRLWHPGYPDVVNVSLSKVHVSPNSGGATAIASADAALGTVPMDAQWEEVLFSSPVALTDDVEYCVWWERACDGNQDVARTEPYFTSDYTSQGDLLLAVEDTGRFNNSSVGDTAPFSTHAAIWYWIDPIVSAA